MTDENAAAALAARMDRLESRQDAQARKFDGLVGRMTSLEGDLARLAEATLQGLEAASEGHRLHSEILAEAAEATQLEAVREVPLPGFELRIEENEEHAGVTLAWRDAIPMAEVHKLLEHLGDIEEGNAGASQRGQTLFDEWRDSMIAAARQRASVEFDLAVARQRAAARAWGPPPPMPAPGTTPPPDFED